MSETTTLDFHELLLQDSDDLTCARCAAAATWLAVASCHCDRFYCDDHKARLDRALAKLRLVHCAKHGG
jgi:hypothetical protein